MKKYYPFNPDWLPGYQSRKVPGALILKLLLETCVVILLLSVIGFASTVPACSLNGVIIPTMTPTDSLTNLIQLIPLSGDERKIASAVACLLLIIVRIVLQLKRRPKI